MGALLQLLQLSMLLLSLVVLFATAIESGDAMSFHGHHCIHDTIQMKPAEMPFVQTKGSSTTSKRQNQEFLSIRIHTLLDPSATAPPKSSNIFVDPYGPFQRALTVLSSALLVRPIQGNLTIPPMCTNNITNGSNAGKCFADSVDSATACGSFFNVSADLVGTIEACNTTSSPCTDVGPDGPGVADTDFVLFVGAADLPNCGASTPAFSSSCAKDNYYRPSAGYINICPNVLDASQDDQLFQLFLHEMTHVLGFSANLMPTFINNDGETYNPVNNFDYDGTIISGLTSPKVVALGQAFFNCSSLEYVALENNNGFGITSSHWEARILLHETMSSVLSNDYNIFSNFTLRYFEDSGWYKVNYTYTNALTQYQLLWGKGLGCDFVLQSCDNPSTYPYHCNHLNTTHQCTFDRVSKGTCKQSHFLDGCYTVVPDFNGACITVNNATSFLTEKNITEVYGTQSRCFEHSDECNSTVSFSCLATQLVRHNASGLLAYYIDTDETQVWCRDGKQVYVEERLVTCPSTEYILLRADPSMITTVEYIPPPLCHESCSSCAVMNDATQCLSCPTGSSLLGIAPSNCSAVYVEHIDITDCPCTEGDLRLMDGSTQYEGRVEICLDEEWGVVCDDGFGTSDARVVCRQLGFDPQGALSVCCSTFGSGAPLPMTIDYLYCTGNESTISECSHNGDGVSSCYYYEAAGVRCGAPCLSDDQVDLVITYGSASNTTSGIVRVCSGGSGGVVCDSGWDFADARVACKAAGYSPYGAVSLVNQYLSSASYPPLINDVGCSGSETFLSECPSSDSSCSYYDYAGVTCQDIEFVPDNCTHGNIRLVGGLKAYEGRVEVCINQVWGTVCDINWNSADANVACRQAGFSGSGAIARTNAYYGLGNGPILLSGLTCSGSESSLLNCSRSPPSSSCDHLDDSGVTCQKPCDGSADFLSYYGSVITSTGSPVSGIVRVCYQSSEYVVCDYGWDFAGAKVACRSAGLSPYGAVRLINQFSYYITLYSSISIVHCQGNESSLTDCSFSSYSFCYYFDYAGAYCQGPSTTSDGCDHGDIRLMDGIDEGEGRVEVCINEVWGTVCDSGWNSADANVVCRQAGFSGTGAVARINAYYGQGSGPVLLSSLSCSGAESSLLSCYFTAPSSSCDHGDDAGVTCQKPCVEGTVEILDSNGVTVTDGTFGIVSLCINKTRTVLCDFSWDNLDARVVCKQLGFSEYGAAAVKSQYLTGHPLGYYASICEGDENDLQQCLSNSYSSYCSFSTLAGVSCQANASIPDNCTDGTIRLVGGTLPYEGNVQICYNNLWGVICDSGWSSSDAQVICKQLGYLSYGSLPSINSYYGSNPMPVYLSNVVCSSSSSSIEQCSASYTATCGSDDYAGVRCGGSCNPNDLSLFSGTTLANSMSGIIQTCVFGVRGVICDYNWDHIDASVACAQLGFSPYGALASINQYLSSTYSCTLPDLLTNMTCTGQETSLSECSFDYGSCSYYDTAGVVCQNITLQPDNCTHGDIKLVGGNGKHEGTVHICINQIWGTICDSGWSSVDAGVVCQQLGFGTTGAQYLSNSYFGKGSGQVFLTSVGCSSSSSNLMECSYSPVPPSSYCNAHYDDAGVICEAPCEGDGLVDLITSSGTLSSTAAGIARVCVNEIKGTICDYGWGFTDASVACRAAGYSPYGAIPLDDQYLSYLVLYSPLMSYVSCVGNETALTQCTYSASYCSYYNYAGVACQSENTIPDNCTHGEVRLAGSSLPWQGRVEVCINSLWSTVCDNSWSLYDARAVCAQVGYPGTGAQALLNSFFGDGTAPALINYVGCSSYSTYLLGCSFSAPASYCSSNNAAGVICEVPCSDGLVQLIQSSGSSGVVRLCDNSKRYLICDYGWNHLDASIACKSVGLSPYGAVATFNQYVSSISGYSFLSYVNCNGSESNLTECTSTPRSYSCYNNYAGIRCQVIDTVPDNCTHGAVRLVGGTKQYEGNVEVCVNGIWSTICDSGWSSNDARVACGDAGYPGAGASARTNSYFGIYDDIPVLLSGLGCTGSEVSLLDCTSSVPSSSCDKYDIAGVVCEAPCSDGSVQLLQYYGSLNYTSGGVVQICFEGKKFLVCDHGWDFVDSRVLCQSVGFSPYGAVAIHNQALSSGVYNGLGLLSYVSCNGTETNFTDCEYNVLYSGYCNYNFAAVYCQAAALPDNCTHGEIRLVGGTNEYEGTVEVCVNDIWGTVCDLSWSSSDASVACSQLGYSGSGASAQYNARFGTGSGPVLLSGLLCGGSESSFLECTSSIPSSSCDHFDDAGVICQAPCAEGSVQLIQSTGFLSTSASGIAKICGNTNNSNSNDEYLICDYGWDFEDASVTCKSAGYSPYGAVFLLNQYISSTVGYSFLGYMNCTGSESNLIECQSQVLYGSCYSNYAGARCQEIKTIPDNCKHGEIRLVGGTSEYEGNVEVCINGIWSTICDSGWSTNDARVACAQAGYPGTGVSTRFNSYFGVYDDKPMLLSSLGCYGSETSLLKCSFSTPSSSCDKYDIAGVVCEAPCVEGSVQLIQSSGTLSTSASGIVKLCSDTSAANNNNNRYLICDYGWDFEDANVACKSAGYSPYGAVFLLNQYISSTVGYSFLGYMNCTGSELNLTECQSQILYGSCYYNYAGARCQKSGTIPDDCEHGEIRLFGGTNEYEGNVEICINGIWSTICDSGWSSNDARVACAQAGYPGTVVSTRTNSYFGVYDDKPMLLSYLGCYGSETSLLKCSFSTPSSSCDKYDIAGVVCEAPCVEGSVQLIQSTGLLSTSASGIVRLCSNTSATNSISIQYLICDYGWGFADASVACKSAGYSPYGAIILLNQYISSTVGYSFLSYVNCNGSEINLFQCQSQTYYYSCNYNYAGVRCQGIATVPDNCEHGEIRLVGGFYKYEGNVEICINGVWSTICDSGWSSSDARVACAQAGYPGGGVITRYNSYFGVYEKKMLLSYVYCSGSQLSLLDCSFSTPSSSCDKYNIAGVTCEAPCIEGDVQLLQSSNGVSTTSGGVVQVCLNEKKYLICDYGWDFLDSKVLCQYLGYSPNGAVAIHNQALSSSVYSNLPLLRYVVCNGSESSLANCDYEVLLSGYCNYNFAGVYCQANDTVFDNCEHGEIQLDRGFTDYEGTVKICINGVWSTICDSGWSTNDARVACAQAGYPGLGSITRANSYFGVDTGPMLLSSFSCYGSEVSLLDCGYTIPSSSCDQYDIAGVTCEAPCTPGSVSLITSSGSLSSTSSGLVRMCNSDNHYFLVCEYNWDYVDASVACKSAGYSPYGAVRFHNQQISSTIGYSFLSFVSCDGSESTLSECEAEPQSTSCSYNYAGVFCQASTIIPNNCTHGDIRLVGGSFEYEGNVEVCVNGVWSTICDSSWSTYDVRVACSQAGYPGQGAVPRFNSYYGAYDRLMLLSSLTCYGQESSLLDCNFNVPSSSCDSYDIAGVKCEAPCTDGVKLLQYSGSLNSTSGGVVQLCVNQTKYLICDDGWDFFSASILCQSLGYSSYGAVALHDQSLTSSAYYNIRHLRNVTCDGTESSFIECTYELSDAAYCNYNYVGVYCQDLGTTPDNCTQGDMKLIGGTTVYEGTLQVCVNSVWGTVCDSSWSYNDAVVACSQLGYGGIEVTAEKNSRFGAGNGPVLLSGLACGSNDKSLLECRSSIPSTFCDHSDDAGLTCEVPCVEGSVELRTGYYGYLSSTSSGIVTICFNGVRSLICDTDWDFATARITCESLGYSPIGAIPLVNQWLYSNYYNAFKVVDNTKCSGIEANITECDFEPTLGYCNYNLAGVNCQVNISNYQTTSCVDGDIRLVNGSNQYSGRVEICANNVWGTVCDNGWSGYDARVVCNQLGLTGTAASAEREAFFGPGSGPVLLSGLSCNWNDLSLLDCYSYDPSYCSHSNDAGVICEAPCVMDYGVDLVYTYSGTISDYNYGAVRLCVNGTRYPICDSGWDDSEASIACKSAGYSPYGAVTATNQVVYSINPALKVDCIGNETDISECTVGFGNCSYYTYAGVSCQDFNSTYREDCEHGAVRLMGGASELEGRVEICINNAWGTICDSGWSVSDARVVCQQLGYSYSGVTAYYNAYFGAGSGPILLSGIYCITGYESSLLGCSYSYAPYYCDHYDDAGVSCTYSTTSCSYGDVRLVGGSSQYEGRVEICVNNVWGTVCDDEWGAVDAEVVCHQLGYPTIGAIALPSAAYGQGSGPIFLDNVGCNGAELTLLDCSHNGIAYENCNHYSDAGVKCPAGCPNEMEALNMSLYIEWPQTDPGVQVIVPCPCGNLTDLYASRSCTGDVLTGARWEESNTANCSYEPNTLALCAISTMHLGPQAMASMLENLTSNAVQLKPIDISIAVQEISELIGIAATDEQVRDDILDTVQNLMNANKETLAISQQESQSTSQLQEDLESLGSSLVIPDGQTELTLIRETFALKAEDVVVADFTGMTLSISVSDGSSLTNDSLSSESTNPTASIKLPSQVVDNIDSDTTRFVFQTFLTDSFYQPWDNDSYTGSDVNSIILSADVFIEGNLVTVNGLPNPVTLQFAKMRALEAGKGTQCVYWIDGKWSSEGCETDSSDGMVTCKCNHLSSFAIISVQLPNHTTVPSSVQTTTAFENFSSTAALSKSLVTSSVLTTVSSGTSLFIAATSSVLTTVTSGTPLFIAAVNKSSVSSGLQETALPRASSSTAVIVSVFVVMAIIVAVAVAGIAIVVLVMRKKLRLKETTTDEVPLCDDQDTHTKSDPIISTQPSFSEKQDISEM